MLKYDAALASGDSRGCGSGGICGWGTPSALGVGGRGPLPGRIWSRLQKQRVIPVVTGDATLKALKAGGARMEVRGLVLPSKEFGYQGESWRRRRTKPVRESNGC